MKKSLFRTLLATVAFGLAINNIDGMQKENPPSIQYTNEGGDTKTIVLQDRSLKALRDCLASIAIDSSSHIARLDLSNSGATEIEDGAFSGFCILLLGLHCKDMPADAMVRLFLDCPNFREKPKGSFKEELRKFMPQIDLVIAPTDLREICRGFYFPGIIKLDLGRCEMLETIPDNAFKDSDIREIILPTTIRSIGENAFSGSKLRKINLEELDCITSLEGSIFACSKLRNVKFPRNIVEVAHGAFSGCRKLELVDMRAVLGDLSIESFAFAGCENLHGLILPRALTIVGNNPFSQCFYVDSINLSACKVLTQRDFWLVGQPGAHTRFLIIGSASEPYRFRETAGYNGAQQIDECITTPARFTVHSYLTNTDMPARSFIHMVDILGLEAHARRFADIRVNSSAPERSLTNDEWTTLIDRCRAHIDDNAVSSLYHEFLTRGFLSGLDAPIASSNGIPNDTTPEKLSAMREFLSKLTPNETDPNRARQRRFASIRRLFDAERTAEPLQVIYASATGVE
ncbi:MAG: leucine-rich repeat domain-containing protein [Holosporaceae bacterium]|jgi:hypothetical protein|nr:leucine-rich repeat domain-containing protein [Holosporaceae bacterium]